MMAFRDSRAIAGARRQRGVALAMLLWFVAAMMVLVATITLQARVDIRLTQLHAERARAEALADGAIQLALAEMRTLSQLGELDDTGVFVADYGFDETAVSVVFQPLAGLVDLNLASEDLLFLLFLSTAGLEEPRAAELAINVVEWRSSGEDDDAPPGANAPSENNEDGFTRGARLEAVEDLLMVPGFDRGVFDAVRDAVYVGQRGQPGVDWTVAPPEVLQALGGLSLEDAQAVYDEFDRGDRDASLAPAGLDLSFQEERQIASFRVDARVQSGPDTFLRRRWVDINRNGADGLPWRFVRSEAVRLTGPNPAAAESEEPDA